MVMSVAPEKAARFIGKMGAVEGAELLQSLRDSKSEETRKVSKLVYSKMTVIDRQTINASLDESFR